MNKTFVDGPEYHLNACVGDNTGGDAGYGYVIGFAQAVEVLVAAAKIEKYIDPENKKEIYTYLDALIYPICFCARHHVELFLKQQIAQVSSMRGDCIEMSGHDINELWENLKTICEKTDRSLYTKIIQLEDYISDFANIDSTGQTFRYQFDTENNQHLKDFARINIGTFSQRFKELREIAEEFENLAEVVWHEYRQGTYTDILSRSEIAELAISLPPFSTWSNSEEFKKAKTEFITKYNISNKKLYSAIDIIKTHREFASHIGIEIPLKELGENIVERLTSIRDDLRSFDAISNNEWAALSAIYEVGRPGEYSEAYDRIYAHVTSDNYAGYIYPSHIFRLITRRNDFFRIGLKKLGQKILLEHFNSKFPPPIPPSIAANRELIENFFKDAGVHQEDDDGEVKRNI